MRKEYVKPETLVMIVETRNMICSSIVGVADTGNLSMEVDNDETDEYLSRRRSYSVWDYDDEE